MRALFAFLALLVSVFASPITADSGTVPTCIVSIDASDSGILFPIEVAVPVANWGDQAEGKIYFNPFTHNVWQSNDQLSLSRVNKLKDPVRKKTYPHTTEWKVVQR